jgi:hypothetical protein
MKSLRGHAERYGTTGEAKANSQEGQQAQRDTKDFVDEFTALLKKTYGDELADSYLDSIRAAIANGISDKQLNQIIRELVRSIDEDPIGNDMFLQGENGRCGIKVCDAYVHERDRDY